ncbi:MAG: hypothetical protein OEQ39_08015 [Gammaproteobacteria bacterium]|nr:hypothetical protein [Gammaproteobacteria bacterium]MDH3466334.1 hypothetical protein [Gammaproteobacteria bacterium]
MRTILSLASIIAVAVAASGPALGQDASGDSDGMAEMMSMPTNPMTMDKVRGAYGSPQLEQPAVGEPPITRWEYDGYTVYFEHQMVITSVADAQIAPKMDQ